MADPTYQTIPELTTVPWTNDLIASPVILRCPGCGALGIINAVALALIGGVMAADICCVVCWTGSGKAVRLIHYPNPELQIHIHR